MSPLLHCTNYPNLFACNSQEYFRICLVGKGSDVWLLIVVRITEREKTCLLAVNSKIIDIPGIYITSTKQSFSMHLLESYLKTSGNKNLEKIG